MNRSPLPGAAQTDGVTARVPPSELLLRNAMNEQPSLSRRRALQLYATGQALIVAGAGAMSWLHSWVPMALAGSAALLLTLPLVRSLAQRRRTRR